jgi:predicted Fe-S protein YdhL (DUF1289 family)
VPRFRRIEEMGIETPWIGICSLDAASGLCIGCGRTVEEIASWARLAPEQRRKIMVELAGRRRRVAGEVG